MREYRKSKWTFLRTMRRVIVEFMFKRISVWFSLSRIVFVYLYGKVRNIHLKRMIDFMKTRELMKDQSARIGSEWRSDFEILKTKMKIISYYVP